MVAGTVKTWSNPMPKEVVCAKCGRKVMVPDASGGSGGTFTCSSCLRGDITAQPPPPAPAIATPPPKASLPNRTPLLIAGTVIVTVVVLFACGVGIFTIRYLFRSSTNASDKELIVEYLNKNAHDPLSLEIVEWHDRRYYVASVGKPDHPKYGVNIYYVRVRAKNAFGAKVVGITKFEVKKGKIIEVSTNEDWPTD